MALKLVVATYAVTLFVLSFFSLNRYVLITLFRRHQRQGGRRPQRDGRPLPVVTIQLPIYNEYYVAERLIASACALDYPRHLLEIQVLDDSTDETLELTRRLVRSERRRGIDIQHIHRADRVGYKSGALAHGLERARGEFTAVFDADFVIPPTFLRDALPYFDDPDVGIVQTRWSYLNEGYSLLTRANALGLSGQFVIEQPARDWGGLFLTFNGTAGILRTRCIRDAGGWHHDTLTEDLDLSYRAQLRGWRIRYLSDVTCPSELPADVHALKTQQYRWTKGSQQTARKLIAPLWSAAISPWQKLQGSLHLLGNSVYPFLLLTGILNPLLVVAAHGAHLRLAWPISAYFLFSLGGTFSYYGEATRVIHGRDWLRRVAYFPIFLGASIGLSIYNAQAAIEGALGRTSAFERTPKYNLIAAGERWAGGRYRSRFTWSTAAELAMGLYTAAGFAYAVIVHEYGALPFLALFAFGYLLVGGYSLRHMIINQPPRAQPIVLHLAKSAAPFSEPSRSRAPRRRVGSSHRARGILPALVVLVALDCGDHGGRSTAARARAASHFPEVAAAAELPAGGGALDSVTLVQKNAGGGVEIPGPRDPTGTFWYTPAGSTFGWRVAASHLVPGRAYRVEIVADGAPYDVASVRADANGALRDRGQLTSFANHTCVGPDAPPTTAVTGTHEIRVIIKDDGAPSSGALGSGDIAGAGSHSLSCSGNADHRYDPQLMEAAAVIFHGQ